MQISFCKWSVVGVLRQTIRVSVIVLIHVRSCKSGPFLQWKIARFSRGHRKVVICEDDENDTMRKIQRLPLADCCTTTLALRMMSCSKVADYYQGVCQRGRISFRVSRGHDVGVGKRWRLCRLLDCDAQGTTSDTGRTRHV